MKQFSFPVPSLTDFHGSIGDWGIQKTIEYYATHRNATRFYVLQNTNKHDIDLIAILGDMRSPEVHFLEVKATGASYSNPDHGRNRLSKLQAMGGRTYVANQLMRVNDVYGASFRTPQQAEASGKKITDSSYKLILFGGNAVHCERMNSTEIYDLILELRQRNSHELTNAKVDDILLDTLAASKKQAPSSAGPHKYYVVSVSERHGIMRSPWVARGER